jgi:hypothetical protein
MRALNSSPNVVDNSDLVNFPDGRIKDNDGSGNGTGVNERTNGDLHQTISRLMRLYGITPNNLPDNITNGYQIVDALVALASKNDYILPLTDVSGVLFVPVKLSFMMAGESLVCKSAINVASQTQISGSDALTLTFTKKGNFKNNEYVRLIKTASGVELVRLADDVSLDDMVGALNYLKKATQAEEDAGAIDTKATTPLSNLTAFVKRVIGTDSVNYLAKPTGGADPRNGLLSKEDKKKLDDIGGIVKMKVVKLDSWLQDRQFTVFTGLPSGAIIQGINVFLECKVSNSGYSAGDVVTAPTPYPTDGGRTAEQGIGVQFKESVYDLFRVLVLDQVTIAQAWTVNGSTADDVIIGDASQWALRFVILYI